MLHRVDEGQPIRDAMKAADLTIHGVAARTKEIDSEGKGLSPALIGFYVSTGASARDTASEDTADLIAAALDRPREEFFAATEG